MNKPNFIYMTPNGLKEIKNEIEKLKQSKPTLIQALAAARALGDLSENAEYSSAKRDLRHVESRIRYLEKQITYSKVVNLKNNSIIDIGSTVTVKFLDDDEEISYEIVGKHEANVAKQKISFQSPLGKSLLHKKNNDIVTISSPDGKYKVEIVKIS